MAFCIIYITHESEEKAKALADHLVGERLAACANIFAIQSMYWWEDVLHTEDEWVSIVKTTLDKWPLLRDRAEELHPYDVPCIMKIEVEANAGYERWIREETRTDS